MDCHQYSAPHFLTARPDGGWFMEQPYIEQDSHHYLAVMVRPRCLDDLLVN